MLNARVSESLSPTSIARPQSNPEYLHPAEWAAHCACWLAWPSHEDLWQNDIHEARNEFVQLCRAIADRDPATGFVRGERLEILVHNERNLVLAREALKGLSARFHKIPFGDIWLRNTGPVFVTRQNGKVVPLRFRFNGWGGKYDLPGDTEVSEAISQAAGLPGATYPWVFEGGSVELDGEGTCLTTQQCLLNANRNPERSLAQIEEGLKESFGVRKILWLRQGLMNDHTDGHVDSLARFAGPGVVLCAEARSEDDPNREVYEEIARGLSRFEDAKGRQLRVIRVPAPGRVQGADGRILPASYLNFYIANTTVVVPAYGTPWDAEAIACIGKWFPGRKTVGVSSRALLGGGGAFHRLTLQQPVDTLFRR